MWQAFWCKHSIGLCEINEFYLNYHPNLWNLREFYNETASFESYRVYKSHKLFEFEQRFWWKIWSKPDFFKYCTHYTENWNFNSDCFISENQIGARSYCSSYEGKRFEWFDRNWSSVMLDNTKNASSPGIWTRSLKRHP